MIIELHLRFCTGVISITAGAAPAEGGISASAEGQAARAPKRAAENQAIVLAGGGTQQSHTSTQHYPGKCKSSPPSPYLTS